MDDFSRYDGEMKDIRRHLPNTFTLIRIVLTPVFLISLFSLRKPSGYISIVLFFLLSLTDYFDGYFARRWGLQSSFGEFMDPLADKLLLCGAFISFAFIPGFFIPAWLVAIILFREIFVTVLRVVAIRKKRSIVTEYTGKLKTAFQMLSVFCLLFLLLLKKLFYSPGDISGVFGARVLWTELFGRSWGSVLYFLPLILVALSAVLALVSMIQYLVKNWKHLFDTDGASVIDFTLKLLSTVFFAGYFPLAPGSFASLIGVALWILISSKIFYYVLVLFVVILGFFLSHYAEKRVFMRKDAQRIVIDEVAGMLAVYLTFSFTADVRGLLLLLSGFLFFRFFDIVKPPPIRNVQNIGGGLGIMLDDLLSAFGAHLLLRLLRALL